MEVKLDTVTDLFVKLSIIKKVLILVGILALISGCYTYFLFMPKQREISLVEAKLNQLEADLAKKQAYANKLAEYKEEVANLKEDFAMALIQLPGQKEIPSLLSDISRLGKETGLEFLLFKPKPEVPKDFYSEIPVDVEVLGSYHKVATFFDKIGNLSRIVNVTNVSMNPSKSSSKEVLLSTTCLATTFRFLEEREKNDTTKPKGK